MKKIAHIQLFPLLSGVQRVTLDELIRLDPDIFESYVICKNEGPLSSECNKHDITCLFNSNLVREISLFNDVIAFFRLYKIFRTKKFDIVHTHSSKTGVLGRVAAKLAGVPKIVHTVHGFSFPSTNNKMLKAIYFILEVIGAKCSDIIICLHNDDYNFAKNMLRINERKLLIIPNGVDLNKFSPPTISQKTIVKNKFDIPDASLVIGMVGRLWIQKNPQCLLDASLELLKSNNNIHLVFVGDGELRNELENIVQSHQLADQIHFYGWLSDPSEILKLFDIFVLPSLWEGLPLAILEAQATGIPCIVSNIQGNNHLIHHNINGLLFESNNSVDLSDCLNVLINSASLRCELGNAGYSNIINNYSISERISRIERCYLK